METNLETEQLAPYVAAAKASLWLWPAIGVMVALLFASFAFDNPVVPAVATAAYVVGVLGAVIVQAKRSGVQPSFSAMPSKLKSNLYRFWGLSTILGVLGLALGFATNFLIAGIVLGVGFALVGTSYHKRSRRIVAGLAATP